MTTKLFRQLAAVAGPELKPFSFLLQLHGFNFMFEGDVLFVDVDGIPSSQFWKLAPENHGYVYTSCPEYTSSFEEAVEIMKDSLIRQARIVALLLTTSRQTSLGCSCIIKI